MVVVSILPRAEFGPNEHRVDAPHFSFKNKKKLFFSDKRQSEYAFGFSNVLYQIKKCDDGFELKQIKILSGYIQETVLILFSKSTGVRV